MSQMGNYDIGSTQDNALDLIEELYWNANLNEGNELYYRVERLLQKEGRLSTVILPRDAQRKT